MDAWKIWCQTTEELDKVLAKMESEGIKWRSGQKPTELTHGSELSDVAYCAPIGLTVHKSNELHFSTETNVTDFMNAPYLQQYKTRTVSDYMAMPKPFTMKDLKPGHIVTTRSGEKMLYLKIVTQTNPEGIETFVSYNNDGYYGPISECYRDDLTHYYAKENSARIEHDIVKVGMMYDPAYLFDGAIADTIWTRSAKKMTKKEIEVVLGYEIEIVGEE